MMLEEERNIRGICLSSEGYGLPDDYKVKDCIHVIGGYESINYINYSYSSLYRTIISFVSGQLIDVDAGCLIPLCIDLECCIVDKKIIKKFTNFDCAFTVGYDTIVYISVCNIKNQIPAKNRLKVLFHTILCNFYNYFNLMNNYNKYSDQIETIEEYLTKVNGINQLEDLKYTCEYSFDNLNYFESIYSLK